MIVIELHSMNMSYYVHVLAWLGSQFLSRTALDTIMFALTGRIAKHCEALKLQAVLCAVP